MLADDIDDTSASKRERFRNIIQLIQLTTTILSKGGGPILRAEEPVPNPYATSPYTYLDAAARLLVRKDEVVAATECTSFHKDFESADSVEPTLEIAVVAQCHGNNVPVTVGIFTSVCCGLLLRTISPRR
jgi:hypothetical protein